VQLLLATTNPHKLEEIRAVFELLASQAPLVARIELIGLDALGLHISEPVEDQPTFEGNAALKARYYARATGRWCLADDSGLEVDALGGEPGVLSARFAGVTGPRAVADPANNSLLLERLKGVPAERRTARFVCAMALAAPDAFDNQSRAVPARSGGPPPVSSRTRRSRGEDAAFGPGRPGSESFTSAPTTPDDRHLLALVRGTVDGRILGPAEPARGGNGFGYDPLFLIPDLGRTTAELDPAHKNAISHRGRAARAMWAELVRLQSNSALP
jgi:XTP/dITP diphosphohydrolase